MSNAPNDHPARPATPHPATFAVALVLAWVLPGAGHFLLGQRQRAVALAVTILGLFLAGLLIGGIDVIDSRRDRLWFYGQTLVGPTAFVLDHLHARFDASLDIDGRPLLNANGGRVLRTTPWTPSDEHRPYDVSIGRVNEIGTLYCSLAGVLNLLVMLDIFARMERSNEEDDDAPDRADAPKGAAA